MYVDIVPKTCENFMKLCSGEAGKGRTTGAPLHYKSTIFHRVIKGFIIQGGDFSKFNGTGGESIWGGRFDDENFDVKHTKRGLLAMANKASEPNSNGSQFFITCADCSHLNGKHVVFGELVSGFSVLSAIENQVISSTEQDKPIHNVCIAECGIVDDGGENDSTASSRSFSTSSSSSYSSSAASSRSTSYTSDASSDSHYRQRREAERRRAERLRGEREKKMKRSDKKVASVRSQDRERRSAKKESRPREQPSTGRTPTKTQKPGKAKRDKKDPSKRERERRVSKSGSPPPPRRRSADRSDRANWKRERRRPTIEVKPATNSRDRRPSPSSTRVQRREREWERTTLQVDTPPRNDLNDDEPAKKVRGRGAVRFRGGVTTGGMISDTRSFGDASRTKTQIHGHCDRTTRAYRPETLDWRSKHPVTYSEHQRHIDRERNRKRGNKKHPLQNDDSDSSHDFENRTGGGFRSRTP